ncbi:MULTISPECIES: GspE/PulE family protein [Burkholderia]|uniref:General secretion pathway protein E n=1 Tax=Burkholderia pyrrocinia TaxID=60550 RepID=A0A318I4U2_BURPY|nr:MULTISPECIES: GspE/PulE family protein [Burkholderia]PXX25820.1 general secretion pathway protein E [Burkholderia pyrrocinia]SFW83647.1 general secretion pathway protein E [Burkholderia sp. NFACC33-1]SFY44803.1 general secretion pathway protein E [Burkholderia sp. NFPP32]
MTHSRHWQEEILRQELPAGEYVARQLAAQPDLLPEFAGSLGLHPLRPEQIGENWRFDLLPLTEALTHAALPVDVDGRVYLVLANPLSLDVRNWASTLPSARQLMLAMSLPNAVTDQLRRAERSERVMEQFGAEQEGTAGTIDGAHEISVSSIARDESRIVRLVNSMLLDALQSRASDIHVESTAEGLTVKYRVDGVLRQMGQMGGVETAEEALSRLKVLAELDIGERRVPQDGRFKARIRGRDIDFRVSIMPSIHGEDAVLRVLDKSQRGESLRLESLGLDSATIERIRLLANEPYGMLLVTGPTGSGKSTTLYAALSETNTGEKKIITIEDPVEYELSGVLQIPVNEKKGLSFARGLRSILRHDPDTILVGEIRDGETAAIAVQAALTGHLVMSSVHANTPFSVLERFLYMGVEPASFVEALNGIVAQRLIRRVCEHCAAPAEPEHMLANAAGLSRHVTSQWRYRVGAGCNACLGTGYSGRLAVAEVLRITDALKDGLLRRASAAALRETAREAGHITMREVALANAADGQTTLQEVHRVIALY